METLDLTPSAPDKVTTKTVLARHTPRATFSATCPDGRSGRQLRSGDCRGISAVDAPSTRMNPTPMARAMRPNRGVDRSLTHRFPDGNGGYITLTAREIRAARKAQA